MENKNTSPLSSCYSWGMASSLIAKRLLPCLLALFFIAPVIRAQTNTGQLQGLVKDQAGAVIPGVTVTATHVASNLKVERVTDESGQFLFPSLAVGEYTLSASLTGFKQLTKTGIDLRIGQVIDLDLELEAGEISVTETVPLGEQLLQTTTAEVSDVIERRRVTELPLNGRQFLQLALLSEGVVKPPGGTRGGALQQAGELVNVAGQRSGHNIYLLDGVKITDEYFNNMVISPSVDAIQEFKIQKTSYAAEFGGKAAALINVATKAGTREFHGNAFEFLRNEKLDARNFFDDPTKPIPPFKQNQFGGTLGGPVRIPRIYDHEDRAFFFISYEGQRISQSLTKTFSVPTAAMRAGDLSAFGQIYDPFATDANGNRLPLAGNRIPTQRLDPVALGLLARVPLPNQPGISRNLISTEVERTDTDQFSLRLDDQLTEKDALFFRASTFNANAFQPFGTGKLNESLLPGFGRQLTTKAVNLAFSHTHYFTPDFLNEFRFGYLRASGGQVSANSGVDFASTVGLNGVTENPADEGYPLVSLGGLFSNIGDPTTFVTRRDTSLEFYDNVFVNRGAHKLKFGVYLYRLNFNPVNPEAARGSFSFTGQFTGPRPGQTGNAFADFLLGYPGSAQVGIGRGDEQGRTTWFHSYVQDEWNPTRDLTINLGLRWEINQPIRDINNRLSAIDYTVPGGRFVIASDDAGNISPTAAELLPLIPIPYVTSAEAGWDRSLLRDSPPRLAPRFGIAWRLPGKSETVLRGGYGIYLNQWAYSVQQALARNLPFFLLKNINVASDTSVPTLDTQNILTSNAIGNIGGNNVDHDFSIEYATTASLSLQHMLTSSTAVEFSYVGSNIQGADSSTVRNVPLPGNGPIAPRRPIPRLSSFTSLRWDGYSSYHAGTLRVEKRLTNGFSMSANYTFSKSIDDASDPGGTTNEANLPQDVRDRDAERALSSFDHTHRFVASGLVELPFGRNKRFLNRPGLLSALAGGWRLTGIVTLQSGAPFTVNDQTDRANIGQGPAQRPNCLRDPNLPSGERTVDRYFDTSAFTPAAFGTFGNCGRNIVIGPSFKEVDLAAAKLIHFGESKSLEFRTEVFNLLNTPNFDTPNRFAFTPNFGKIFSAGPSRQIQFGLKLAF
ncbi:MAG TPA: carboxypeptidase-like regulatory domain-containing protein [Pyrinomonadaceae bacterium]|nr:carboxypeptidase-like regulatory domain-containing protein [Pyrinomonadaceae bacterium]